jgi:hypothetical protein
VAVIASLNVAVTETFLGVPVAEAAGTVDETVGAVVSEPEGLEVVSLLHATARNTPEASATVSRCIEFFP